MREQQHDQGQKPPGQQDQSGSQRGQQSSRQDQMKKQPSVDKSDKASFGDARKDAKFPEDDKSTK